MLLQQRKVGGQLSSPGCPLENRFLCDRSRSSHRGGRHRRLGEGLRGWWTGWRPRRSRPTGPSIWPRIGPGIGPRIGPVRPAGVGGQHRFKGVPKRSQRQSRLGRAGIPTPIPGIDVQLGVQKKGLPGVVVIEVKSRQVDPIHLGEAHADKPLPQGGDVGVLMSNLPIPNPALGSPDAAENHKQRFARRLRLPHPLRERVHPAHGCGRRRRTQRGQQSNSPHQQRADTGPQSIPPSGTQRGQHGPASWNSLGRQHGSRARKPGTGSAEVRRGRGRVQAPPDRPARRNGPMLRMVPGARAVRHPADIGRGASPGRRLPGRRRERIGSVGVGPPPQTAEARPRMGPRP